MSCSKRVSRWKTYIIRVQRFITDIKFVTDWRRKHSNTTSFIFKHQYQRSQQYQKKSFIITRLLSPRESFNCGPSGIRWNKDGKRRTVCHKPRSLKHRGITRKPEYLLKIYSRELSSTIDRYKNGKNAYIYSKQQQQRNQDTALKALRLHGFWQHGAAIFE